MDDGYSGTNFNRPDWQRLLGLIEEGRIGIIIVKDMSRLGRDYLQVGMYTEMVFPNNDIRFIAINNGVDSENQVDNDMTPFINIFNEFYAKDTSKKVKAVFRAKGNSGKPLTTNPPYGYLKDPNDKHHWVVDPEAAPVVRDIFKWSIFEDTHEAIIDQETFDIVQRIRDGRRRLTPMGEMPVLSGMLFCADCGAKLYQVRARGWSHEQEYFTCASYRKGQGLCSPHQIHNVQVEEILLRRLKQITAYARAHETEFVELVTKQNEKEIARLMRDSNKELAQARDRIRKLDTIMQRLYEDNIEGKISDERFARMTAAYEAEQKGLETRAAELEIAIAEAREQRLNVDSFLVMVRRYTDITELTAEIIRSFVEKIEVKKPEKVPGSTTKKQTLVIWWNFIGVVDIPDETAEQRETA